MSLTHVLQLIFALGLLFLGRKLYWVFVGAVGFIAVTELVVANFSGQPEWLVLVLGLAAGVIGAVLAVFVRMAGIGLAGLLGGAYIFQAVAAWVPVQDPTLRLVLIVLGAVVGLLLVILLFDWALIILSSFTGALILTRLSPTPDRLNWLVTIVLLAVGVLVQARLLESSAVES